MHLSDDDGVTQTYKVNLSQQTYIRSRSGVMSKRAGADVRGTIDSGSSSHVVARVEAERRWSNDLHRAFGSLVVTYGEIIGAIDAAIQTAATDAELRKRGAGLEFIRQKLKLSEARPWSVITARRGRVPFRRSEDAGSKAARVS